MTLIQQTDLHVETWGDGDPVVLVHGSLALAVEEWDAQRPLAEQGFELLVVDRRGYGRSPAAAGEDFLADADDIAGLLGTGAHLVGHSYGGLSALLAAARHPAAVRSLTVLEAPIPRAVCQHEAWVALLDQVGELWHQDVSDEEFVVRFLKFVGSDPDEFPPEMLASALPLVPLFRRGRPFYEASLPIDELRQASFPKLVVSGGHHAGFDAACSDLATRIGGAHRVVEGAGHEIQFTGPPINELLVALWREGSGRP